MTGALLPAVIQDARTGRVLMLGYMDDEARRLTRETGQVHFWSRSKGRIWKKGETSGNVLRVVEVKGDCDADTFLVRALPAGPTCHTGATTCFGTDGAEPPPSELHALEQTIGARKAAPAARSYTRQLLDGGPRAIGAKIAEEAAELCAELLRPTRERGRVVSEAADLLFHVLVGLGEAEVAIDEVLSELGRRAGRSGLDEKAAR